MAGSDELHNDIRTMSALARMLERRGRWRELFEVAQSPRLLKVLAKEYRSPSSDIGCTSPLEVIELATRHAVIQHSVADVAALVLVQASWLRAMSADTTLLALQTGDDEGAAKARNLVDRLDAERMAVWYLLLAWEMQDRGDAGGARAQLRRLLMKEPPSLGFDASRRAVILLRNIFDVDPTVCRDLQKAMLDENQKQELVTGLTSRSRLESAFLVAMTMEWRHYRVTALCRVARALAKQGRADRATEVVNAAVESLADIDDGEDRVSSITEVAACWENIGQREYSDRAFELALAGARELAESGRRVAAVALAMAKAGRLERAEKVTAELADEVGHDLMSWDGRQEVLERIAIEYARSGSLDDAFRVMQNLSSRYIDYERAATIVGTYFGKAGQTYRIQSTVGVVRPSQQSDILANIIDRLSSLGEIPEALAVAELIEEESVRLATIKRLRKAKRDMGDPERKLPPEVALLTEDVDEWAKAGQHGYRSRRHHKLLKRAQSKARLGDSRAVRAALADTIEPIGLSSGAIRIVALARIAVAQARDGQRNGALLTADRVLSLRRHLSKDERHLSDSVMALVYAELGRFDEVWRMLGSVISRGDGLEILDAIVENVIRNGLDKSTVRELRNAARKVSEGESFQAGEGISRIGVAQARVGDHEGAMITIALTDSVAVEEEIKAALTEEIAQAGDTARALDLASEIMDVEWRTQADVAVAREYRRREDAARTHDVLVGTLSYLSAVEGSGERLARCLLQLATACYSVGEEATARAAVQRALNIAQGVAVENIRWQSLLEVVGVQCEIGDSAGALATARSIQHPWFAGDAIFRVAAVRLKEQGLADTAAILDSLESPWWRAAGMSMLAAAADLDVDGGGSHYWQRAHALIAVIPRGDGRTRLQHEIFSVLVEVGDYSHAMKHAASLTSDLERRLPAIAQRLVDSGAGNQFLVLVPQLSSSMPMAIMGCLGLAICYPMESEGVVSAVVNADL